MGSSDPRKAEKSPDDSAGPAPAGTGGTGVGWTQMWETVGGKKEVVKRYCIGTWEGGECDSPSSPRDGDGVAGSDWELPLCFSPQDAESHKFLSGLGHRP